MIRYLLLSLSLLCSMVLSAQFRSFSTDIRYVHRDVLDLSYLMQAGSWGGNKHWFDAHTKPAFRQKEGIWADLPDLWETYSLYSQTEAIQRIQNPNKATYSEEEQIWGILQLYLIDRNDDARDHQINVLRKAYPDSYLLLFSEINLFLTQNLWNQDREAAAALLTRIDDALKQRAPTKNQEAFLKLAQFDLKSSQGQTTEQSDELVSALWKEYQMYLDPEEVAGILSSKKEKYGVILSEIDTMIPKSIAIRTLQLLRSSELDYAQPVLLKELLNKSSKEDQNMIKILSYVHTTDLFESQLSINLGRLEKNVIFPDGLEKRRFSESFKNELLVALPLQKWNDILNTTTHISDTISQEKYQRFLKQKPSKMTDAEATQLFFGSVIYYLSAADLTQQTMRILFHTDGKQPSLKQQDIASIDAFFTMMETNPYFDLSHSISEIEFSFENEEDNPLFYFSDTTEFNKVVQRWQVLEQKYPASVAIKLNLLDYIIHCFEKEEISLINLVAAKMYANTYINLFCLGTQFYSSVSSTSIDLIDFDAGFDAKQSVFNHVTKAELLSFITRLKVAQKKNDDYKLQQLIEALEDLAHP